MKTVILIATGLLSLPLASFAVDSSPRCDPLPSNEKEQCLKDEAAKTDSKAAPETAASGSSASQARPYDNQDRSPRCDLLSGAEKDQCLKDEAAKRDTTRK